MIIVIGIIVAIIVACYIKGSRLVDQDITNWNNGTCHKCGYHWTLYDYDKDLGRIYKCTKCGDMTHVITSVDKKYVACEDPDHPDYIQ